MKACMRCGERFSHNYLVEVVTILKDKWQRLIVCLKCRDILNSRRVDGS